MFVISDLQSVLHFLLSDKDVCFKIKCFGH
jgi:hypothetical protein